MGIVAAENAEDVEFDRLIDEAIEISNERIRMLAETVEDTPRSEGMFKKARTPKVRRAVRKKAPGLSMNRLSRG